MSGKFKVGDRVIDTLQLKYGNPTFGKTGTIVRFEWNVYTVSFPGYPNEKYSECSSLKLSNCHIIRERLGIK